MCILVAPRLATEKLVDDDEHDDSSSDDEDYDNPEPTEPGEWNELFYGGVLLTVLNSAQRG